MSNIICLCLGIVLGAPLGWAVLLCLVNRPIRRAPTKDEWKVM